MEYLTLNDYAEKRDLVFTGRDYLKLLKKMRRQAGLIGVAVRE